MLTKIKRYEQVNSLSLSLSLLITSLSAQETTYRCLFEDDSSSVSTLIRSGDRCSENGWVLPTTEEIKVLVVLMEYDNPSDVGHADWPSGQLPSWVNSFLDFAPSSSPSGIVTEYFQKASHGEFSVLGDYLLAAQNNGVFKIPTSITPNNISGNFTQLLNIINSQTNGVFTTVNGVTDPQYFNNWTLSTPGAIKDHLPDAQGRYDHVAFIIRHPSVESTGSANEITSSQSMLGYPLNSRSINFTKGAIPTDLFRHEFGHLLYGGNNFHCAGGGRNQAPAGNYWIADIGGHSLMSLAGSALRTWNGWDQYRLGWKPQTNQYQISARNEAGQEVDGDLDALVASDEGVYVIRDFVTTGDALRIKLPYLDPQTEFGQWFWLENHRGAQNNGFALDEFGSTQLPSCATPAEWGLTVSMQIDRDENCGSDIYGGSADHIRMISADGMWESVFDNSSTSDQCNPSNSVFLVEKVLPNPLTGHSDLDRHPIDLNNDGQIQDIDQTGVFAERVGNNVDWQWYFRGHPRQFFRLGGKEKMNLSTNPTVTTRINQIGDNAPLVGNNVKTIYINGISIKIIDMLPNGDIKVEIKFDHVDIEEDVRWCAPDIVLNEIPTAHGYSLVVKPEQTLHLDHGTAATNMDIPITFENQQVFTSPTSMHVKSGAHINLEANSEMVIDRRSSLKLEAGSALYVQNGATLRIRREGTLELLNGSLLQVENGGKVIVEGGTPGGYARGNIIYHQGTRINLQGTGSIIDISGRLHIADGALFRLSRSTNGNRTSGKIIFRSSNSTQVTAGTNTSLRLQGNSLLQEVVINEKDVLLFPSSLTSFRLTHLRVSQAPSCSILPPFGNLCDIFISQVSFRPIGSPGHNGLSLSGQAQVTIKDCYFYDANVGIGAFNITLGSGLNVSHSYFENCSTGIGTYSGFLNLSDTDFNGCYQDWDATAMTGTSSINDVNSQNNGSINIRFNGNATLLASNSYLGGGDFGIRLDGAVGKLYCMTIKSQNTSAIDVINGASLFMNNSATSSDISFNSNTFTLNQAVQLNLDNGGNDLRSSTFGANSIVTGSIICPAGSTLAAISNVWNNGGTAPLSSDYMFNGVCGLINFPMSISDNSPLATKYPCVTSMMGFEENETLTLNESSTLEIDSILMGNGLSSLIDAYTAAGNTSLNLSPLPYISDSTALDYIGSAQIENQALYSNLYNAIEAFETVTEESSSYQFTSAALLLELYQRDHFFNQPVFFSTISETPDEQQVHAVLSNLSSIFSSAEYPEYAFWTAIWAAEVLHTGNHTQDALNYLSSEAPFAYDDLSAMVLNRFICQMEYELIADFPTYEEWSNQANLCEGISNDQQKSSHNDQTKKKHDNAFDVKVFPNPTSGQLFLEIHGDQEGLRIEIYDINGREIQANRLFNHDIVDVSSLTQGLYLLRLCNGYECSTVRFVLNK